MNHFESCMLERKPSQIIQTLPQPFTFCGGDDNSGVNMSLSVLDEPTRSYCERSIEQNLEGHTQSLALTPKHSIRQWEDLKLSLSSRIFHRRSLRQDDVDVAKVY